MAQGMPGEDTPQAMKLYECPDALDSALIRFESEQSLKKAEADSVGMHVPIVAVGTLSEFMAFSHGKTEVELEKLEIPKKHILALRSIEFALYQEGIGVEYMLFGLIQPHHARHSTVRPGKLILILHRTLAEACIMFGVSLCDLRKSLSLYVQKAVSVFYAMFPTLSLKIPPKSLGCSLLEFSFERPVITGDNFISCVLLAAISILRKDLMLPVMPVCTYVTECSSVVIAACNIFGAMYQHCFALEMIRQEARNILATKCRFSLGNNESNHMLSVYTALSECIGSFENDFDPDADEFPLIARDALASSLSVAYTMCFDENAKIGASDVDSGDMDFGESSTGFTSTSKAKERHTDMHALCWYTRC